MRILVCAATGKELAALAPDILQGLAERLEQADYGSSALFAPAPMALSGRKNELLVSLTGVGPLNAALAMGLTLEAMRRQDLAPTLVLNVGLAGAYDLGEVPLRSLCCVVKEIWPEYGLHDGKSVTAQAFSWPQWQRSEERGGAVYDRLPLLGMDDLAAMGVDGKGFMPCSSLTVAGVSASFDRAHDLRVRYGAQLENMEGFAVAYACARCGIPCLEIRSVSNKVGPRAKHEKDFPGALEALGSLGAMLSHFRPGIRIG